MALQPTIIWRVRKLGNNVNGGGYDPSIAGAGTDYSQQDAAQLSLSDIACSNTTAISSVTGGFTAAMIGNAVWLTGGGATASAYFLTAVANSNNATIDRAPGNITAGSGKVGGGWADPWTNIVTTPVAGNEIHVQGGGTNRPTVDDYARTGFVQVSAGNLTNGMIRFIGENGLPRIASNGLMFFNQGYLWFEKMYISANGTNYASPYGVMNIPNSSPTGCNYLVDCVLDQNGHDIAMATASYVLINTEVVNTGAPGSGSSYALDATSFGMQIVWCNIHDTFAHGVRFSNKLGNHITDSIIAKCAGDTFTADSATQGTDAGANSIINVTLDGSTGDALKYLGANGLQELTVLNNIISNHVGAGKYGVNVAFGTLTTNDAIKGILDYNAYYGNTTDVHTITKGANDITGTNPQYGAQATEGYNIGQNLKAKGYPQIPFKNSSTLFTPTATQMYVDTGGVQRQEGAP